jgi:hypothetical protein
MILAGHETTAVALCWSVYLLAQLPEVQERIAHEAASARADSGEEPQLSKLIYTRTVLDEIMRLYPPAYVIVRAARQRDTVAGVELSPAISRSSPPGCRTGTASGGMSRMHSSQSDFCRAPQRSTGSRTCPLGLGLACALALTSPSQRPLWSWLSSCARSGSS